MLPNVPKADVHKLSLSMPMQLTTGDSQTLCSAWLHGTMKKELPFGLEM